MKWVRWGSVCWYSSQKRWNRKHFPLNMGSSQRLASNDVLGVTLCGLWDWVIKGSASSGWLSLWSPAAMLWGSPGHMERSVWRGTHSANESSAWAEIPVQIQQPSGNSGRKTGRQSLRPLIELIKPGWCHMEWRAAFPADPCSDYGFVRKMYDDYCVKPLNVGGLYAATENWSRVSVRY